MVGASKEATLRFALATIKLMTNTELTLGQLHTMSGGLVGIIKDFAEAWVKVSDNTHDPCEPVWVYQLMFLEPSVKEGGCEDPNVPTIG